MKPLMEAAHKRCQYKYLKKHWYIGVLYKSREIVKQPLLKQLYFCFIYCHLNYADIAWASTYKSKLEVFIVIRNMLPYNEF